jgi:DNA-binding NarL/FixJ family response regulator
MADHATVQKPPTIRAAIENIRMTQGRARQSWRAFDTSPVPMVTVDAQKRYQAANAAARLAFRLSLAEWLERRIEDLTPPHMTNTLVSQWDRLLRRGSAAGRFDCELPDGEVTIAYCAIANALPGQHLIVFLPSALPDDELDAKVDASAPPRAGVITRREREVLTLIASGANSQQIATELSISVPTVRTHTRNLLHKLGARNRAHAIALAMQHNWIEVPPLTPVDG